MLKRIATTELRLGMHLHRLEGSWLEHPFLRARFVIRDEELLRRVQGCGVPQCWIDTDLGLDVARADEGTVPAAAAAAPACDTLPPAVAPPTQPQAGTPPPQAQPTRALQDELHAAADICRRGREAVVSLFEDARLGRGVRIESCRDLVEEVSQSVARNPSAIVSLARLKTRDDYTYMHSMAVCALMVALAQQLGMDEPARREAGLAGLVHDVGKALVAESILNKPGRLTDAEWAVIRTHPERGHALLAEGGTAALAALDVALHHHERFDGRGYPHALQGVAASQLARMGAICDVYDAITSNRPYKAGWDPAASLSQMASWTGQFDSALFNAFVYSLGIYPIGSVVRLESGRQAVVVEQNPTALLRPAVRVFYCTRTQQAVAPVRIDLAQPDCQDRVAAREPAAAAQSGRLDELWADPELVRRLRS